MIIQLHRYDKVLSSAVITWSNLSRYYIQHCNTVVESESDIRITTDTPYRTLTGELWRCFCEDFGESWLRYNGTALYCVLLPDLRIICMTPAGVAGMIACKSRQNRPTFTTWNPSTSFSGATALHTARSLMCSGTGNWTNKPSTELSSLRRLISANNASWDIVSSSWTVVLVIPEIRSLFFHLLSCVIYQ